MLEKEEIVSPNLEELKNHYRSIITLLGEDAEREGLLKTPERVAKAMLSLTKGYHIDPHEVLRSAKFKEEYSQMVIVKDIDFFSLCSLTASYVSVGNEAACRPMPVSPGSSAKQEIGRASCRERV